MKILKPILFLTAVTAIIACHKTGTSSKNCDEYWIAKAQNEWLPLSSCSPQFKHHLGKGIYNGIVVYYTSISCINCNIAPPQYGFSCKGDTIWVADWREVTDTKVLATCRSL